MRKIPEEALYAYFQDISTITPVQVLLLLYILMYNEAVIAYKSDPKLMALDHGEQHGKMRFSRMSFEDTIFADY